MRERLDIEGLRNQARLDVIVEHYLHAPLKRSGRWSFWRCPFHSGGSEKTASFGVTADDGRWKCFGCSETGDVFEFVRRMEQLGTSGREFVEVAKKVAALAGAVVASSSSDAPRRDAHRPVPTAPSVEWQRQAKVIVTRAQEQLWKPAGEAVLRYLTETRGLREETVRAWGLGYWPSTSWDKAALYGMDRKDIWLPQGLVIPGEVAGVMWYVKFRPTKAVQFAGKYYGIPGGCTALLGADRWELGKPLLLCEGEMDMLTAWQEAREFVNTATLGGAAKGRHGQALDLGRWTAALMRADRILVAFDNDEAGEKAAGTFAAFSSRCEQVNVPYGSDINEFHTRGGKVRGWVESLVGRREESRGRWPLVLVFPSEAGLAMPMGRWTRLGDGRIEAVFVSPEELQTVLDVTAAIRAGGVQ